MDDRVFRDGIFADHVGIAVIIAEEPAADVDVLIRRVIQFNPVRGCGMGMGQQFIEDNAVGR